MHFCDLSSCTSTAIFRLECPNLVGIYGESQINKRKKINFKEEGEKRKTVKKEKRDHAEEERRKRERIFVLTAEYEANQ